jgi:hypothetical protein
VARSVDDVDALFDSLENFVNAFFLPLRPGTGCRRGRDGDAALALLFHPVGDGGAFVHLTHPVDHAGVKQHALGDGRLAGIDVRSDPNVPRSFERELRLGEFGFAVAGFSKVAVGIAENCYQRK